MSTTASLPRRTVSRRTQILASASALVAAASVAVTLAVGRRRWQHHRVAAVGRARHGAAEPGDAVPERRGHR